MRHILTLTEIGLLALLTVILLTGCATSHTGELGTPLRKTAALTATPSAAKTPVVTNTPTTPATPTPVPSLTWDALRNIGYPNEWPSDGIAELKDGEYREQYLRDSATEMVINLAPDRLFGDLNGDGAEDAAVILIAAPGGSGTFYYLSALLNQQGRPRSVASRFLGDRVLIRRLAIDDRRIDVELDIAGPGDPMCCPTDHKRQVHALEGEELKLIAEDDLPDPDVSARLNVPKEQTQFEPGATSATYADDINFNGIHTYQVHAVAGQTMEVTIASPHSDVLLSLFGAGRPLVSIFSEVTAWTGEVPTSENYSVNVVAVGSDTAYTLTVGVTGAAEPSATPTPRAAPEATSLASSEKVIHITFDDAPTGPRWTPQILDVLDQYDAQATFFVLGRNARRFPHVIEQESQAGHVIANHTLDHQSLSGIGRDAFFREVLDTERIHEDKGHAACALPTMPQTATPGRGRQSWDTQFSCGTSTRRTGSVPDPRLSLARCWAKLTWEPSC